MSLDGLRENDSAHAMTDSAASVPPSSRRTQPSSNARRARSGSAVRRDASDCARVSHTRASSRSPRRTARRPAAKSSGTLSVPAGTARSGGPPRSRPPPRPGPLPQRLVFAASWGTQRVEHGVPDALGGRRQPGARAAKKSEGGKPGAQAGEFYELGLGEVQTVSALQGSGTGDLLAAVVAKVPPPAEAE